MTTLRAITLPAYDAENIFWKEFYGIFRDTINPNISQREFKHFYLFQTPKKLDVDFIYSDNRLVGFIGAAFYSGDEKKIKQKVTIARGTAGILPMYRGGMMPSFRLCLKYIRYKLNHPFEKVFVTGYMANPKLYSMMCRYAARVYPKTNVPEPAHIKVLRDAELSTKHRRGEYLVKLHFPVLITEREKEKFAISEDEHIKFFLQNNPCYTDQTGLFTIIPVDASNILHSVVRQLTKKWSAVRQAIPKIPAGFGKTKKSEFEIQS